MRSWLHVTTVPSPGATLAPADDDAIVVGISTSGSTLALRVSVSPWSLYLTPRARFSSSNVRTVAIAPAPIDDEISDFVNDVIGPLKMPDPT